MNKTTKDLTPEHLRHLDISMSLDKLMDAYQSNSPIVGKVLWWDSKQSIFHLELGNGFFATLPIDLASIYPALQDNGLLTPAVRSMIGKSITVTVESIDTTDQNTKIVLSRRDIMKGSFDFISNSVGQLVECCITGISPSGVFVDVGNGITGLILYSNLCASLFSDASVIGLTRGSIINARIMSVDNNNFHVDLNYKDQFENFAFILNAEDLIEVKLVKSIHALGYYAYINPNTYATISIPIGVPCKCGDKVIAKVEKKHPEHPDRLRLSFVSFS